MLEARTISSDEMQHAQQFAVRTAQDYLRIAKDNVAYFTHPWSDATLCLERAPAFRSGSWRQLRCRLWSRVILHFRKSCGLGIKFSSCRRDPARTNAFALES
jgi:hypothetical protein